MMMMMITMTSFWRPWWPRQRRSCREGGMATSDAPSARPPRPALTHGQWSYLGQPAESSSRIIWQTTHGPHKHDIRQSLQIEPFTHRHTDTSSAAAAATDGVNTSWAEKKKWLGCWGRQKDTIFQQIAAKFRHKIRALEISILLLSSSGWWHFFSPKSSVFGR